MVTRHFASKSTCCISQVKGLRIIAGISCAFGLVMGMASSAFGPVEDPETGELIVEEFAGDPMYVNAWTQVFAALQILVSLLLVYAKGTKRSCQIWTGVHIAAVIYIGYYLWNLLALIHQTFGYQLYLCFLGIHLCITTFMILVVIEIIIHPNPGLYPSPEKRDTASSNLRKPV